jgi:hypothetical protein
MNKRLSYQKIDIFLDSGRLALLKGMLESKGIHFYVSNENFSRAYGMAVMPEVFVDVDRIVDVREIVDEYLLS